MEDLDPPREIPGAAEQILHSLKVHGLRWDGPVMWQSERHAVYEETVQQLLAEGRAFRCDCSRSMLQAEGGVYRGRCRDRNLGEDSESAVRVKVEADSQVLIDDAIQTPLSQDVAAEVGDFVIRRRDGLYAYQLAVVLDDALQGITHVLRGSDLYDSTPRQVYLQRLLDLPTPRYAHIPVIVNAEGQKLSKQTHAPPVKDADAVESLRLALRFLGQSEPPSSCNTVEMLLRAATDVWDLSAVPRRVGIPESSLR